MEQTLKNISSPLSNSKGAFQIVALPSLIVSSEDTAHGGALVRESRTGDIKHSTLDEQQQEM